MGRRPTGPGPSAFRPARLPTVARNSAGHRSPSTNPYHLAPGESPCSAGDACSPAPALLVGASTVLPPEVPPAGALDGSSVVEPPALELPVLELLLLELPELGLLMLELPALELPAVAPLLAADAGVLSVEGLLAEALPGGTAAPGAYLPPLAKFAACISDRQVELPKNTTLSSFATITASSVAE